MRTYTFLGQKFSLSEKELCAPLTEAELQLYDSYNERNGHDAHLAAARGEIVQTAGLQKSILTNEEYIELGTFARKQSDYILCDSEVYTWKRLGARIRWHRLLADYRYSVENSAFEKFPVDFNHSTASWSGGYNLPDVIEQYEHAKSACGSFGVQQLAKRKYNYAQGMLLQLEQEDSALWVSLDPDRQLAEAQRAILGEVIGKIFTSLREHVSKDLADNLPPVTDEPPVAQQAESDQPEVAGAEVEANSNQEATFVRTSKKPVETIDPRDASEKLEVYLSEFSTAECDELAEAVGLNPPAHTQRKNRVLAYHSSKGAKTKIYAIADVLDNPDFDRLRPGQKIEFIKAFGYRLGFPSKKPERNASSLSYETASKEARTRLKTLIEERDKEERDKRK